MVGARRIAEAHAPAYAYVGMHAGDGALLGVWVAWDSLDYAVQSGEVVQIGDPNSIDRPGRYLHISDHGNATLYYKPRRGPVRIEWAVV